MAGIITGGWGGDNIGLQARMERGGEPTSWGHTLAALHPTGRGGPQHGRAK